MKNRVIICGGGDSISGGLKKDLWSKIKDEEIWSINYAFLTMQYLPHAEIWTDVRFFRENMEKLQELSKQGVKCYAKSHIKYNTIPEIKQYNTTREIKEMGNKFYIGYLGLSGSFALHLACVEGFKDIYLLGYDFGINKQTQKTHYYQDTLKNIESSGVGHLDLYEYPNGNLREQVKDFEFFLKFTDSKIWNVSPNSNIPFYEKITYETFFSILENHEKLL